MKRAYIILLLIFLTSSIYAAWRPPIYNFSALNSEAERQNWSISQGANGWLYFGNNEGLLEYNGVEWVVFPLDNSSIVRSVECVANGDIFVGGQGEFGRFSTDLEGRLSYENLSAILPDSLRPFGEVWGIHSINDHTYFRTRRKIFVFDKYDNITHMRSDGVILASCVMNKNVYFVTPKGLFVVGEGAPISISRDSHLPFDQVCAIADYGNGRLLLATSFDGIYIYDNGDISRFRTSADSVIIKNQPFSIAVGEDYIACGTVRGGLFIMDLNGDDYEQIDIGGGLGNNTVLSVKFDSDNNLWCGLDNGIDMIMMGSPLRHFITNSDFRFSGYCTYLSSDYLYMGTNQGLIRVNSVVGNLETDYTKHSSNVIENSEGQVWNIQSVDGRLFCSHTRGLFLLEDEQSDNPYLRAIYTDDGVWGVTQIDDGRYLLGTYEGLRLMKFDGDSNISIELISNYGFSVKDMIYHRPTKSSFIIVADGLHHVTFDDEFTTATSSLILKSSDYDIKPIEINGELLIYTPLKRYIVDDSGVLNETTKYDHLFEKGAVYAMITVDDERNIWYVQDDKLLCRSYSTANNRYDDYAKQIFDDRHFFIKGFTRVDPLDGRYYIINSIYGFSIVNSRWNMAYDGDLKPVIVGLYDTGNRDTLLMSSAYGVERELIELDYSQNSLRMVLGSNMVNDNSIEYSYRLRGNDSNWSAWSSASMSSAAAFYNRKEYTNLREGRYYFDMRVKGRSGVVGEDTLEIVIRPPWQRSTAMYTLYIVLFIFVTLYVRMRISRYYAVKRRFVELQKEREIEQQKRLFKSQSMEQENNIIRLKNEKLESEVLAKSTELSNLLLNKLEKNDIIASVKSDLDKIRIETVNERPDNVLRRISSLNRRLDDKMIDNVDWGAFEENFNLLNNNFVHKIVERFSWMSINERKLCVYIKMGLQNKEIAPLLNLSVRGVEMLRYRIRKKMELDRSQGLYEFFQSL